MLKRAILVIPVLVLLVLALFAAAGRWDWWQGWLYIGVLTLGGGLGDYVVWRKHPDLLRRRSEFGEGTKSWDYIILFVFGVTSVLVMIVGALDSGRYHWSDMSVWWWPAGAALYAAGQVLLTSSMLANPFFEKTARIQTDQQQRAIDSGPYRYVRHPGYIGTIIGLVMGSPLLLGSWWAFAPALVTVVGLVIRTVLEDRMLQEELEGYRDYVKQVPYRLIPMVW